MTWSSSCAAGWGVGFFSHCNPAGVTWCNCGTQIRRGQNLEAKHAFDVLALPDSHIAHLVDR